MKKLFLSLSLAIRTGEATAVQILWLLMHQLKMASLPSFNQTLTPTRETCKVPTWLEGCAQVTKEAIATMPAQLFKSFNLRLRSWLTSMAHTSKRCCINARARSQERSQRHRCWLLYTQLRLLYNSIIESTWQGRDST